MWPCFYSFLFYSCCDKLLPWYWYVAAFLWSLSVNVPKHVRKIDTHLHYFQHFSWSALHFVLYSCRKKKILQLIFSKYFPKGHVPLFHLSHFFPFFFLIKRPFVKACTIQLLIQLMKNNLAINKMIHMMTFHLTNSSGTIPHVSNLASAAAGKWSSQRSGVLVFLYYWIIIIWREESRHSCCLYYCV